MSKIDLSKYSTILFDVDGTITKAFTSEVLPSRTERLTELKEQGKKVAFATNQAGPIWGLMTGNAKYPTSEKISDQIWRIHQDIGLTDIVWFVSLGDPRLLDMDLGPNKRLLIRYGHTILVSIY